MNWTRNDLESPQQIERLLRAMEEEYRMALRSARTSIARLHAEIASLRNQLTAQEEQFGSRISALDGAVSTALRISPADVAVYDEATNTWITGEGSALELTGHLIPALDDTYDIGSTTKEWRNLYLDGTANLDTAVIGVATTTTLTSSGNTSLGDGGTNHYTRFTTATGIQTMVGNARVYRTQSLDAGSITSPGAHPATAIAHGTLETPAWQFADQAVAGDQETITFNMLIPVDMDRTVDPFLSIGWSADGVSPGVCEWQFEYLYTAEGEDTGAAAQDTLTCNEAAPATADGLVMTSTAAMDTVGASDTWIHGRITRLSAGGTDTIADTVELHGISLVYVSNKLGIAV